MQEVIPRAGKIVANFTWRAAALDFYKKLCYNIIYKQNQQLTKVLFYVIIYNGEVYIEKVPQPA